MTRSSSPDENGSRFGSLRAVWLTVATFLFIGVVVAAVWHSVSPEVFESSATVQIEPRDPLPEETPEEFFVRHDQLIGEDNIVKKALESHELAELTTLRDLSRDEQIKHIQLNLAIQQSKENVYRYLLCFRSRDSRDAQTVLAMLVSTYEKHLAENGASLTTSRQALAGGFWRRHGCLPARR